MTIPDLYKIRSPVSAVACPRNQRNSAKTNVLLDGGFGLQGVVVGISISSSRTAKDAPCMSVSAAVPCIFGRGMLILITFSCDISKRRIMLSSILNKSAIRVFCRPSQTWMKFVLSSQKISIVSQKGPAFFDLIFLTMLPRLTMASAFYSVQPKG